MTSYQIRTNIKSVELPDGNYYPNANTVVTLTDTAYNSIDPGMYTRGWLTDLGAVAGTVTTPSVITLASPSGDVTGATDVVAINAALTAAVSAGIGIVRARSGAIYQVGISGTQNGLGPSGGTSSRSVCVVIPSGVILDMNGSTLQLRGTSEAWVVANQHTDNSVRDHDLGLVNAVIDGRNVTVTSHPAIQFCFLDRLTLSNVKVINGSYQAGWVFDCANSYFDRLAIDTVQGQGWTFGDPRATGTGHNQVYDSTFGNLRGSNITLLNTVSQPGNPFNFVLTRCTIDSIYAYNCSAGIKLQQPSTDVTINSVVMDTCGESTALNSGFKIQGDATYPAGTDRPTRIKVGQVVAINQANIGLYLFHTRDCSIDSYAGSNNVLLHTANSDVLLAGGINDYIGHIDSQLSNGGGIRLNNDNASLGPVGYRLPSVRVQNCGQNASGSIKSGIRADSPSSSGTFGHVVCIDDQGSHTMSRGIDVTDSTSVGSVGTFVCSGFTDVPFASTAAGFPNPWDQADKLTSGEEVFSRDFATNGTNATTSNTLRLSYFTARKSENTTGVRVLSGGTAAGATPTLCKIALFLIAANGDGTLVASTASDTSLFAATNTAYPKSWAASYAKVSGQRYALGVLVVTAATAPTLTGLAPTSTAEMSLAPRLTGSIAAQSDMPSSFTAGSVASSFSRFYGAVA